MPATHPWALARWRQGTDLLISDLPTVPCRHPPHEIRQGEPPHVSSLHMGPWTLKKVPLPAPSSGPSQASILQFLVDGNVWESHWYPRLVSGGDSGIRGSCSCQLLGPISRLHYPHPVGGALGAPSPRRPARKHRTPFSMGDRCRLLARRESKLSNGHALFREVNPDPMYREANHPPPIGPSGGSPSLGGRLPASCCGVLVGLRQRIPDGYVCPRRAVRQRGHCPHPSPTRGGSTLSRAFAVPWQVPARSPQLNDLPLSRLRRRRMFARAPLADRILAYLSSCPAPCTRVRPQPHAGRQQRLPQPPPRVFSCLPCCSSTALAPSVSRSVFSLPLSAWQVGLVGTIALLARHYPFNRECYGPGSSI